MAKHETQAAEPMPETGCVVCGVSDDKLPAAPTTKAGAGPRWHAECETARPDVIRKVKARA